MVSDSAGARERGVQHAAVVRLTGALDVEALRRTFEEIVRRHEALRTTFEAGTASRGR